ncbi:MAG TPA: hypothetical protein PKH79_10215 [Prolixibacteraceae bacterium]|nr:hypothetical protein [Prolixibacteraceae bacterium]HPS13402.1 hypothetical protein [Prolixibacteraceae bacterium]
MNNKKSIRYFLLAGCALEIILGLLHCFWPFNLLQVKEFKNVPTAVSDLVLLAALTISLCMLAFAFLSFYYSKQINSNTQGVRMFCLLQGIFWALRLAVQFILPIQLPLYFIDDPNNLIISGLILTMLVFWIPVFLLREKRIPEGRARFQIYTDETSLGHA